MKNKFKAQIIESSETTLKGKEIACNIMYDDMTKPPKWFQNWSETVYQNQPPKWFQAWSETVYQKQPPQWFQHWSENHFEPLVDKVNNIETRLSTVETTLASHKKHMTNIETFVNQIVKINKLKINN